MRPEQDKLLSRIRGVIRRHRELLLAAHRAEHYARYAFLGDEQERAEELAQANEELQQYERLIATDLQRLVYRD